MTVRIIQHLPHEHDGVLGEVLELAGVSRETIRAWTGQPVPTTILGIDALVVLGGDMNTDEEAQWPHLADVRTAMRAAVDADVPTLGLCLGAQLLTEAVGGTVTHGTPEIGFPPVFLTPSGRDHAVLGVLHQLTDPLDPQAGVPLFNAHADQIHPPAHATLLAFSDATPVHAFAVGSGLGLQFHAEIDASYVASYVEADGVEAYLEANGWTGAELVAAARRHNTAHRRVGLALFEAWARHAGVT
ncbi:type 1 glutamine amidotransferase [Euzebya tangerina]|uniref:type 1 glutamine amidotransferase n=1 Tax=Euzebya tangerina TaxID=591198 RepID=UPI0013C2FFC4|nr:gamma-glutamyl-gamma-aminobutyrate hydrolase family protein [Euzebya tangerina]